MITFCIFLKKTGTVSLYRKRYQSVQEFFAPFSSLELAPLVSLHAYPGVEVSNGRMADSFDVLLFSANFKLRGCNKVARTSNNSGIGM